MTVTIRHSASVEGTADTVRTALSRFGHCVIVTWDVEDPNGAPAVWIIPAGQTTGDGEYLRPGQQIVVSGNGSYRIETVAEVAA